MRMSKHSLRFYATGLAACALLACDPKTGKPTDPGGEEGEVSAAKCKAQIAARQDELRAEGVDVAAWSFHDAPEMLDPGLTARQTPGTFKQYDGKYRPLTNHPGCTVENLYYDKSNTSGTTPYADGNNDGKWTGRVDFGGPNVAKNFVDGDKATIPGYPCAAKEYKQPDEDTSKPIVILVHGNSTRPHTWEKFLLPPGTAINAAVEKVQFNPDTAERPQLAEQLIAAHYRVIAVDFRTDLIATVDPSANSSTENAAGNIDHGWSTPILESLIKAVMKNNPGRKVALVGHSLGVTVVRDALRRLYVEYADGKPEAINPFPQVSHVIVGSGANHGVSTYDAGLCTANPTMRGTIVCEMGSRSNYVQTYFHKPLNGPKDLFATPCADGDYAFGKTGQCGGNVVKYLTITMTDIQQGANYQDYYVSEAASRIDMPGCVENKLTTLNDYDTSGYFSKGFIANHFGSLRSDAGLKLAMEFLAK
ncbi:triacylglycerol lipase [Vitiosangium sp. GDMCC 1.1324]|uniref:esterase/lipase family protein n=1 Tax=Vitiosangium sp. (strain GDMCC 1.1324) TaxID=2138576 RepID=UPI00130E1DC3|nr:alpha/beta hydrolase [Vitiosangium sp. GDMCC 1.1324]